MKSQTLLVFSEKWLVLSTYVSPSREKHLTQNVHARDALKQAWLTLLFARQQGSHNG